MKYKLPKIAMALVLCASMTMTACTASQFVTVLNEVGPAVATILQIVALVKGTPANTSVSAKVDADVAAVEKLYTDLSTAEAADKGNIEAEINSGFQVLNSDLSSVFTVAQVNNKNTQAKVAALIGLIQSAVQIAEAAIPQPTPAPATAVKPLQLDASSLADSWNKVLKAKTGNAAVDAYTAHHGEIHAHGKFMRVVTLGIAK